MPSFLEILRFSHAEEEAGQARSRVMFEALHNNQLRYEKDKSEMATGGLQATLDARGKTHGDYAEMSEAIQRLKRVSHSLAGWNSLSDAQRETLDSIFLKVGRILTGDPNFAEHWHDIAGYATRMEEVINKGAV